MLPDERPHGGSLRRLVIVGQRARGTADFLVEDIPGTSGRLDVLLRCLRAGLMVSHGLRHDTVVYLVLLGGDVPRTLRFRGDAAKFLRPDERSLAVLVRKVLAAGTGAGQPLGAFTEVRPGVDLAEEGLAAVAADLHGASVLVLDETGEDIRGATLGCGDVAVAVGDHIGFDEATRGFFDALGARRVSVGPRSIHADDAVTLVHNELDRREITEKVSAECDRE